jgi:putative endonuclease
LLSLFKNPQKAYIGYTTDLGRRLEKHNSGGSIYTSVDRPWKVVSYYCFENESKALDFEKYIKTGSEHTFAKKRFW